MMVAYSLFSGSRGNSYYLKNGDTEVLIDAGKSARALEAELNKIGTSKKNISAVFITHTHTDHISALSVLTKGSNAVVYCTRESADVLIDKNVSVDKIRVIDTGNVYKVGSINARCFKTMHDCVGSVGFRFDTDGGESLAVATDLGALTSDVFAYLYGAKTVILEANHDIDMLLRGPYPQALKKRILGREGHLSNDSCAEAVRMLAKAGTERFLIAHLSEENNDRKIVFDCVRDALSGYNCTFDIAKQDEAVEICKK
jgi:phosphoribosyl 1,2-cyclic phosphodiesterase